MNWKRAFLLFVSALALGACGAPPAPEQTVVPTSRAASTPMQAGIDTSGPVLPVQTSVPAIPTASSIATSRGPELEASNPDTARLSAGQLQLVEFFRFT